MQAAEIFEQQNGERTKSYYTQLATRGPMGEIAVALFRAQKRSSRAKDYAPGRYRRAAYEVKGWSIGELCRLLDQYGAALGFRWGWKLDPNVLFGSEPSWVLYVELPQLGQVSFHNPARGSGPDYPGEWDQQHASEARILRFCDGVMQGDPWAVSILPAPVSRPEPVLRFGDPAAIARARRRRR